MERESRRVWYWEVRVGNEEVRQRKRPFISLNILSIYTLSKMWNSLRALLSGQINFSLGDLLTLAI